MPYTRYLNQLAAAAARSWQESLWPLDYVNASLQAADPGEQENGDGRPVVLIPGFMSPDAAMWPLRTHLHSLGYPCYDSLLGINSGDSELSMKTIAATVRNVVESRKQAATLVGISLGGTLATRIALRHPADVAAVITIGAPLDHDAARPAQPQTHIYSRNDGIVDWRDSCDEVNPLARNIEISGTHTGLGINPDVWNAVADALTIPVTE